MKPVSKKNTLQPFKMLFLVQNNMLILGQFYLLIVVLGLWCEPNTPKIADGTTHVPCDVFLF